MCSVPSPLEMSEYDTWQTGLPELPLGYEHGLTGAQSGRVVCSLCVSDPAVRKAVFDITFEAVCNFCGGSARPFAQADVLFEYVYRCLTQEYGDPWHHAIWWGQGRRRLDRHHGARHLRRALRDGRSLRGRQPCH